MVDAYLDRRVYRIAGKALGFQASLVSGFGVSLHYQETAKTTIVDLSCDDPLEMGPHLSKACLDSLAEALLGNRKL